MIQWTQQLNRSSSRSSIIFLLNPTNQWIGDLKCWKCTVKVVPYKSQPIPLVARSAGMYWQGTCYYLSSYKIHFSCRCLDTNDLFVQWLELTNAYTDCFNTRCHLLAVKNWRNEKVGLEEVDAPGKIEFILAWGHSLRNQGKSLSECPA